MSAEEEVLDELKKALGEKIVEVKTPRKRRIFITTSAEYYKDVVRYLADKLQVIHVSTMTGLDAGTTLEVISHFFGCGLQISVKAIVPKDTPELDTITDLMPGALLYEREVHDMIGVTFKGHPDMSRLILPDEWPEGVYPLRKEYKAVQPEPIRKQ